ncbi:dephospho-CoA kinase [soil metagenome]
MLLVGLTGGIGSGKSTVSAMLAERGAIIIDGDAVVRELQQPGSPVVEAIAARFEGVVGDHGHLDRSALAAIVFNDPAALADLNGIVHPPLGEEIRRRIDVERATDHVVVLDLPLLTERPRSDLDATIVVDVDPEIAVDRLAKSRGMDEADARARMTNQASREQRVAIATHVLENSGDVEALESQVDAVWAELRARATQR